MSKIVLNLVNNGLDYLNEGLEPIFKKHSRSLHSWKYSVLHIYSGIQLLLKEKLKQEHWSLIFQDVNNADPNKLENGNFISVYQDELIKRLSGISNISINKEPIQKLRELRNMFEHFEVNISIDELEEIVTIALDEIIKFWENNLEEYSSDEQKQKFKIIKSITTSYDTFRKYRYKKYESAIKGITESGNGLIVICPDCDSTSFAVFKDDNKECKCFVCDKKYSKKDYLDLKRKDERNNIEFGFLDYEPYDIVCPICKKESVIRYEFSTDITLCGCIECLYYDKSSKIEQSTLVFNEWVDKLEKSHTDEEVIRILEKKIKELDSESN